MTQIGFEPSTSESALRPVYLLINQGNPFDQQTKTYQSNKFRHYSHNVETACSGSLTTTQDLLESSNFPTLG